MWGNLCQTAQFSMAEEGTFIKAPPPMNIPGNWYLLAVLNSPIADWYIRQLSVARSGGYYEYKPMYIEQIQIPVISNDSCIFLIIQKARQMQIDNNINYSNELDDMIFDLYGLTSLNNFPYLLWKMIGDFVAMLCLRRVEEDIETSNEPSGTESFILAIASNRFVLKPLFGLRNTSIFCWLSEIEYAFKDVSSAVLRSGITVLVYGESSSSGNNSGSTGVWATTIKLPISVCPICTQSINSSASAGFLLE